MLKRCILSSAIFFIYSRFLLQLFPFRANLSVDLWYSFLYRRLSRTHWKGKTTKRVLGTPDLTMLLLLASHQCFFRRIFLLFSHEEIAFCRKMIYNKNKTIRRPKTQLKNGGYRYERITNLNNAAGGTSYKNQRNWGILRGNRKRTQRPAGTGIEPGTRTAFRTETGTFCKTVSNGKPSFCNL